MNIRFTTCDLRSLGIALAITLAGKAVANDRVLLTWEASISSNVAGYQILYGTNSGDYYSYLNAGLTNSVTITNLIPGTTYYFVAFAYDAYGDTSPFSNEASFRAPVLWCSPNLSIPAIVVSIPIYATTDLAGQWTNYTTLDLEETNPSGNKFFKAGPIQIYH